MSVELRGLLVDASNEIHFSAASIWEVGIKSALKRGGFDADPVRLAQACLRIGFLELPITSAHAARVATLPLIHHDPFDRILIAQSLSEPMTLVTNDALLEQYGPMVKVM